MTEFHDVFINIFLLLLLTGNVFVILFKLKYILETYKLVFQFYFPINTTISKDLYICQTCRQRPSTTEDN